MGFFFFLFDQTSFHIMWAMIEKQHNIEMSNYWWNIKWQWLLHLSFLGLCCSFSVHYCQQKGWWLWWWRWPSSTWIVASPDSNFISKPRCCCRRVNEIIQIVQTRFNLSSFISQIICKCFLEFCEKKYSFSANTLVYARFGLLSCFCFEKKKHCKDISWSYPTISSFLLVSHEKKPFSARPYLTTGRCWFIPPLSPSSTWITHSTNPHLFCYTPLLYIHNNAAFL